jgi:hypothetical protein
LQIRKRLIEVWYLSTLPWNLLACPFPTKHFFVFCPFQSGDSNYYDLNLKYSPKSHVLKGWSSAYGVTGRWWNF